MKSILEGVLLLVKLQALGCNFIKNNTPPWVFFKFFKLHKWYNAYVFFRTILVGSIFWPLPVILNALDCCCVAKQSCKITCSFKKIWKDSVKRVKIHFWHIDDELPIVCCEYNVNKIWYSSSFMGLKQFFEVQGKLV